MTSIVPRDIRAAAAAMESAVAAVDAHVPTAVGDVASALPGALSAASATRLAETWRTAYAAWVRDATGHVAALRRHADDWVETDRAQAARMERLARENL